ncbi:MAG: histidine--tRNA ligase [Acidimicrobiales bacterium]
MEIFRAPIGTHDVLPPDSAWWEQALGSFAQLARRAGFGLLVSPLFEDVAVFDRGIGATSDVATKEMYVFEDRGGRRLALRPEGTASVVRAFVQHRPVVPWKVWYATPAFRYERPQAGRYRQHHQVGVEALGSPDPALDVEVIALAARFYEALGLRRVRLLINSMGHPECRTAYVTVLGAYLGEHADELCEEHRTRFAESPLRVLDCKQPACVAVTERGPQLPHHLCAECREHFAAVRSGLDSIDIAWTLAPRLVRGFDYYTRTTFEFVSDALAAAQNAVGGGGRYDGLAEQLGGPASAGVGFGSGLERLRLACQAEGVRDAADRVDVFVVDTDGGTHATVLADQLRRAGLVVERAFDQRSMKAQMRLADRSGAAVAVLVGPTEAAQGSVTIRDLRGAAEGAQVTVPASELVATVRERATER